MKPTHTKNPSNLSNWKLDFNIITDRNLRHQNPSSIMENESMVDGSQDGDFAQTLIISTLNNWSKQHLNALQNFNVFYNCQMNQFKN
jgi:hypothetical protein